MSRKNKSYTVTIQFASSDPAHRHGMTNRTAAIKHAKATAEAQKGKTVEVYGTWDDQFGRRDTETLRFRWSDTTSKVKERT